MRIYLFLFGALLFLPGCATVLSGSDEDLTFRSEPSGARITIDGIVVGQTPTTVSVDRPGLEDKDVTVDLDGYESRTFELDKEFNTVSILNLFFFPGWIIDAVTGALFKYDKATYTVDLEEGTLSLKLDELPRGPEGQYLLPDSETPITVTDPETGLTLLFE